MLPGGFLASRRSVRTGRKAMAQRFAVVPAGRSITPRRGFSLLELLVALAVISVAGTVYVSFYSSSLGLAKTARNRAVAASLAEEHLSAILRHPEHFLWQKPAEPGVEQFPIALADDDPKAGNPVERPAAMPADEAADRNQAAVYDAFRWKAYGRLPSLTAAYYEVTGVIHWEEAGREQLLSLTSAVPRAAADASPRAGGPKP